MSSLSICDMQGKAVGTIEVPAALQAEGKGAQVVRDAIVAYRANQRVGSANTKTKGEVAGHGVKPWRQKGTGNARAGYRQSPVWRGGGVVFGPKPRDYGKRMNKKMQRLALARIVADRIAQDAVTVIDQLHWTEGKTKAFAAWLKTLGLGKGVLIVVDQLNEALLLASRNIPGVEVARATHVPTYAIARYPRLVVTSGALEILNQRASGATKEVAS